MADMGSSLYIPLHVREIVFVMFSSQVSASGKNPGPEDPALACPDRNGGISRHPFEPAIEKIYRSRSGRRDYN